jgi:hypothetical protein
LRELHEVAFLDEISRIELVQSVRFRPRAAAETVIAMRAQGALLRCLLSREAAAGSVLILDCNKRRACVTSMQQPLRRP